MKHESLSPVQHALPFRIEAEEDLFRIFRSDDHSKVILPHTMNFPLDIEYYYSWTESSGNYTYLIFKRPNWDSPHGLVFRRVQSHESTTGMCSWCHSTGGGDQIGMLTVSVNPRKTIGQYICLNIDCLSKLETQVTMTGKSLNTLTEQLCGKMGDFYEKVIWAEPKSEHL